MAQEQTTVPDFVLPPSSSETQRRQDVRQTGEPKTVPDFTLPGEAAKPAEKSLDQWAGTSWSEVGQGFKEQFLPSVGRAVMAIPQAIMNPGETVEGLKQIGTGAASKVRGAFGAQQEPEEKARTEAVFNAIVEPFTSVGGFKKALATDPYSVLSVAAIPVSGGASLAGKGAQAVGTASAAGRALSAVEMAGKGAAMAMDPLYGAVKGAGAIYDKAVVPAVKAGAAKLSDASAPAYELAYQAGKTNDQTLKSAFNTFAKGQGNAEDFSRAVANASSQMRNAEISQWAADKANALALKQVVPSQPIIDAIQEARNMLGPRQTAFGPALGAHLQLDKLQKRIMDTFQQPAKSPARTLEGFDQMKRSLYELGERSTGMTSDAIKKVNSGVRQAMANVSPQYVELMEKYQLMNDKFNAIRKSLATGQNVSAVRELNAFIRGLDDVQKGRFISELAKYDPRIPYMVAGASINQAAGNPSKWSTALTGGQLANIGWALSRNDPYHIVAATAGLGLSSPGLTSKGAYAAGAGARALESVPAPVATTAAGATRLAPGQLERIQEAMSENERQGRKSGGRVMSASHMLAAAERAKKNISGKTKVLLNSSDDHVAKALEVAKQNLEG